MTPIELSSEILEFVPFLMQMIRVEMRSSASARFTVSQFRILARLSGGARTNRDLAEWVGISTPTVSRTVDVLVRRGYVRRETAKEDKREVRLALTPKGMREFAKIREGARESFAKYFETLPPETRESIHHGVLMLRGAVAK